MWPNNAPPWQRKGLISLRTSAPRRIRHLVAVSDAAPLVTRERIRSRIIKETVSLTARKGARQQLIRLLVSRNRMDLKVPYFTWTDGRTLKSYAG